MIVIDYHAITPIYEQIKLQIKSHIALKTLAPHTMLPSVRVFAKQFQVGIITVKHAYDDLVKEGFLYVVPAKGYYVSELDYSLIKQNYIVQIEALIDQIASLKKSGQFTIEEIIKLLKDRIGET